MLNRKWKMILGGVGLFSAGAVSAWAVTADWYAGIIREDQRLILDKNEHIFALQKGESDLAYELRDVKGELSELKDFISQSILNGMGPVKSEDETVEVSIHQDEDDEDDYVPAPGETVEDTRANLQNLINQFTQEDVPFEDDEDEQGFADIREAFSDTPPHLITEEEFGRQSDLGEDKQSLTYYPKDRVLIDEDEEMLSDVGAVIGWQNLTVLGKAGYGDHIWVRNDRLMTDYEIYLNTKDSLPVHIAYGMSKEEYRTNVSSGLLKFREEEK